MNQMIDDKRPIESAWSNAPNEVGATVGYAGVTRIVVYAEVGNGAMVPWFNVWKGDHLHARLNAAQMAQVVYMEKDNAEKTD